MKSGGRVVALILTALVVSCSGGKSGKPTRTAGYESENLPQGQQQRSIFSLLSGGEAFRLEKIGFPEKEKLPEYFDRGRYLVQAVSACGSCHARDVTDPGSELSGGRRLTDSISVVNAANITPDVETGIGDWNISHIVRALRSSMGRKKEPLSLDVHDGFRWLSDSDARAIAVYLAAQPPVKNPLERRVLNVWERNTFLIFSTHSEAQGYVPNVMRAPTPSYGRYLVTAAAQCTSCHEGLEERDSGDKDEKKHRGIFGTMVAFLSGDWLRNSENQDFATMKSESTRLFEKAKFDRDVREGQFPIKGPNIRGSDSDGLKDWTTDDVVRYLSTGQTPTGGFSDGRVCRWPFTRLMSEDDKRAIALYLKTL